MFEELINQKICQAVEKIKAQIVAGNFLDNRQLTEICKEHFISLIGTKNEIRRIHDILETVVNLYLFEKYAGSIIKNKHETLSEIESLTRKLPTQSWRDGAQTIYQQFPTPPELAFVMSKFIKPAKDSIALEPSAGTGCLANWLKITGCRVEVNEISARRQQLLEFQECNPHSHNAEFLNDLLDPKIKPDFIVMNPPLAQVAGARKNATQILDLDTSN